MLKYVYKNEFLTEVFMDNQKKVFITTAEAILLVSTFFMWMYIAQFIAIIFEFKHIFERNSIWYLLPIITFTLFLVSFTRRRKTE